MMESSAKGKTFEEEIRYALEIQKNEKSLPFTIEKDDRNQACDIRIDWKDLGIIGIEAKDKKNVSRVDIEKFNSDRSKNNFVGFHFLNVTILFLEPESHVSIRADVENRVQRVNEDTICHPG